MTLRTKLLLAQIPLGLALLVISIVSRQTISSLDQSSQAILKDNHLSVLAAQRMRSALGQFQQAPLLPPTIKNNVAHFERELSFQENNITEAGEKVATEKLRNYWQKYRELLLASPATATDSPEFQVEYWQIDHQLDELVSLNQDAMVRKSEQARTNAERHSTLTLAITFVVFFLGTIFSGFLTSRLVRPLSVLALAVRRLGQGDLATRIKLQGKDEIVQVANDFNAMADRLVDYQKSSLGELLEAQESSQALIDSLPDPVLVAHVDGTIVNVNQAAVSLFGIGAEKNSNVAELSEPIRPAITKAMEGLSQGNTASATINFDDAMIIPTSDGSRSYLTRAHAISDEGQELTGLVVIFQDVTKLRRFDELKNDLVATVAHEFKTPLTSLRMAIHLCAEETAGPLTPKQADLLFAAREDCERLQGIVDDLLNMSRIQAGRLELRLRTVAAVDLLNDTIHLYENLAAQKKISLQQGAPTVNANVLVDPDRIAFAFNNLLSNAIRHTPEGGTVELRAAPDGDDLRFEVRDSGSGIDPDHLPFLFDRFYQVPGKSSGGAGLGLYIAKEIITAHGGKIGVASDQGQGSIFWFTVHRAPESSS